MPWQVLGPHTISQIEVLSVLAPLALTMLSPFCADSELNRGAKPVNASGSVDSLP